MKVFVLAPREDWICDRLVKEWNNCFSSIVTNNINDADIIWLLAGWCWNHIPPDLLKRKKVIVTEHHIVPEKFTRDKLNNFFLRDQFVDCYHVPNEKTKYFLNKLTSKRIEVISYWYNKDLWFPVSREIAISKLGLDSEKYYVGSFQRDTEGHDLKTPKLEKGPDLFCDYLERNIEKFKNLHVLLAGWRRQYVEQRLKNANIPYTLYEKTGIDNMRDLYGACNLYIVSSRYEGGPQAIIEAAAMKIPIVSTDVGIASSILSKDCIIDISKDYYEPTQNNIDYAFKKVNNFCIDTHGKNFVKLFEEIKSL